MGERVTNETFCLIAIQFSIPYENKTEKKKATEDCIVWHGGHVVDTWLRDQEVPGTSPDCVESTLSPRGRLLKCVSHPTHV